MEPGLTDAIGLSALPRLERPDVTAARDFALAHASTPMQFGSLEALDPLTQIGERENQEDRIDEVQCGAAALVAGLVLQGEGSVRRAMRVLLTRINTVMDRHDSSDGERDVDIARHLRRARGMLNQLLATPTLTVRDMHRLIRATYLVIRADHVSYKETTITWNSGLLDHAVRDYRDLLWQASSINGLDLALIGSREPGALGHVVLAEDRTDATTPRRVMFDPWPEADGSAVLRQTGKGALLIDGVPSSVDERQALDPDQLEMSTR